MARYGARDQDAQDQDAQNRDSLRRFVENFALTMNEGGFPRMPARVFTAVLVSESGSRTAVELAEFLQVSPAAVSGAVRYLMQVGLISREREPGARRDHYRVLDEVWYETFIRRDQTLQRWDEALREGLVVVGSDTAAGKRIESMRSFFAFLAKELPVLYERWRAGER